MIPKPFDSSGVKWSFQEKEKKKSNHKKLNKQCHQLCLHLDEDLAEAAQNSLAEDQSYPARPEKGKRTVKLNEYKTMAPN